MSGCELGLGKTFDLGICIKSVAVGWVPDWLWPILPWWPLIVVVGGLGLVYRVAGWPGVGAFLFGFGFLVGRKSADAPEPIETDLPKRDRVPAPRKPIKADNSIFEDFMSRLGKKR
jgi:hypothetical protein